MIKEMEIRGIIGEPITPWPADAIGDEPPHLDVDQVLAEIEGLMTGAAKVLLVEIESPGGNLESAFRIYNEIRRLSSYAHDHGSFAGAKVVAYVDGYAASTAPWLALAADYVVMGPDAQFGIHSAVGCTPESIAAWNARALDIYRARTHTPEAELAGCIACVPNDEGKPEITLFDAQAALAFGWADFIGDRDYARALAELLAAGGKPAPSLRDCVLRRSGTDRCGNPQCPRCGRRS